MCLIRIILLSLTLLCVSVAQTDRRSFCENKLSKVVALGECNEVSSRNSKISLLMIGCITSTTNPCVRQDDPDNTCSYIFCNSISQENIEDCILQCNMHPGYHEIGGSRGFTCYCMWNHQTLCTSSNQNPLMIPSKQSGLIQEHVCILFICFNEVWTKFGNSSPTERGLKGKKQN